MFVVIRDYIELPQIEESVEHTFMGVCVFTAPGAHRILNAGWDHPSLFTWQHAAVCWERDYPDVQIAGIYVYNCDGMGRGGQLWVGTLRSYSCIFTRERHTRENKSCNVVKWCKKCERWEMMNTRADHRGIKRRLSHRMMRVEAEERGMTPTIDGLRRW